MSDRYIRQELYVDDNSCVNCEKEEKHDYDECSECLTNNRSNWRPKE